MYCELNKPLCKRKVMAQRGPFERKQSCPLSESPICPLAPPRCPLLPEEKANCPIRKIVNSDNGEICPLAQSGCPCDPRPPCPLIYDKEKKVKKSGKKLNISCPKVYPVYGQCPKTIEKGQRKTMKTPCENNLLSKSPTKKSSSDEIKSEDSTIYSKISNISTPSVDTNELLESSPASGPESKDTSEEVVKPRLIKKGLNVPDCTLSSRRPLPCSECLGDILSQPEKTQACQLYSKDCPYLNIISICDDSCLCDDVPRVDCGPPCPFAPQPCPCCAAVRCPLTRQPECPLVTKPTKIQREIPPCKCYCPVVPPPCSLNIPPNCRMHTSNSTAPCPLKQSNCNCDKLVQKCPLVPDLYTTCPLQATCGTKPQPPKLREQKLPQLPSLIVPPTIFESLNSTLSELNKMCTCEKPPAPQMVNLIPAVTMPTSQEPACITTEDGECPLECPCEPPRTFHVPTCSKKNPVCLRSFPKSTNKEEMVCPFSPRRCPLGRVCPFPVSAQAEGLKKQEMKTIQQQFTKPLIKTEGVIANKSIFWNKDNEYIKKDPDRVTTCPLSVIPNKRAVCPFAPAPCPLDPIKPLPKEPKVCPFAPEPICPLMPKPLCPAMPNCLMKPTAPLPECPYAPPGCPMAPKKLCFPETEMNYECPCPKPKPCPCPKPSSCPCPKPGSCPCPVPDDACPCPNQAPVTKCPCPSTDTRCPCPELNVKPTTNTSCPCPDPNPGCSCPKPPEDGCSCPEQILQCPLTSKSKYDKNCPLAVEKSKKNSVSRQTYHLKAKRASALEPKPLNLPENKCPCSSSEGCSCPAKEGAICPCPIVTKKLNESESFPSKPTPDINTMIEKIRQNPQELDCPVTIPPCEKFPDGRCPMENLDLCNCNYPCPPCLNPPLCGSVTAPPQYCLKPKCCMGLPLPPVVPDEILAGESEKISIYYKMVPTKPDREETKYHVEMLDHPPTEHPFGLPKERENPNWMIIQHGKAFEKCETVAEQLLRRKPSRSTGAQFNIKDNPMDIETKLVLENRENQARLDRIEGFDFK